MGGVRGAQHDVQPNATAMLKQLGALVYGTKQDLRKRLLHYECEELTKKNENEYFEENLQPMQIQ